MAKQPTKRRTKAQKDAAVWLDKHGWGETSPLPDDLLATAELLPPDNSLSWQLDEAEAASNLLFEWLSRLDIDWKQFDFAGLPADSRYTLDRLLWCGLVDAKVALIVCDNEGAQREIEFVLCGNFPAVVQQRLDVISPNSTDWELPDFRGYRLTPAGQQAKAEYAAGDPIGRVWERVWRVSPKISPRLIDGTAQVVEVQRAVGGTFVPTRFQTTILKALDGRALKKQALADVVAGGDGRRFYRPGGLKELRDKGLVAHKHGLGFYRPDAAPK